MKAAITLNCMGLYCTMLISKTAQKMKGFKPSEVPELVDYEKGIERYACLLEIHQQ